MARASTPPTRPAPPVRRSGDVCKVSGLYACETHESIRIMIFTGERFPLCVATRGHKTTWIGVDEPLPSEPDETVPAADDPSAAG